MVDHSIKGSSPLMRTPSASSGGTLLTARLIVNGGTQAISGDDTATIKWDIPLDDTDSWDDIGLGGTGAEYNTNGNIVFPDGEYEYIIYAQPSPDSAYSLGSIRLEVVYSGVVNERHAHQVGSEQEPMLGVNGGHRFLSGAPTMTVVLGTIDVDDTGTISEASIYIKQIRTL